VPLVNPRISSTAPLKVGGAAAAGIGLLASAFDHAHPLIETSGPTNLNMGAILDDTMVKRVGANFIGRMLRANSTAGTNSTSSTALSDASSSLSFAVPANIPGSAVFYALWVLFYNTAATTTGIILSANVSGASAGNDRVGVFLATGPTAMYSQYASVLDTPLGSPTVGPGSTGRMALVFCRTSGAGVGTIALRWASGVAASNVSIGGESFGILIQQ
jgi:hypothetical protein